MGKKMLIVYGYLDGLESFDEFGDFFVENVGYVKCDIVYVDYVSMDDEVIFWDFGDKFDEDYECFFVGECIDVVCYSMGVFVVCVWFVVCYLCCKV